MKHAKRTPLSPPLQAVKNTGLKPRGKNSWRQVSCSVCEEVRKLESSFFARLSREVLQLQKDSERSKVTPFCNLHAQRLAVISDPLACGIIARDNLIDYLHVLIQIECSGQMEKALSLQPNSCMACDFLQEQEGRVIGETSEKLVASSEEGQVSSLCLSHFRDIALKTGDAQLKSRLLLSQLQQVTKLVAALDEIIGDRSLKPFDDENQLPGVAFRILYGRPHSQKDPNE